MIVNHRMVFVSSNKNVVRMPHFCKAQVLIRTSQTFMNSQGQTSFTFTGNFVDQSCFLLKKKKKSAISSSLFCSLPRCVMCLLFTKWYLLTSQKSSKVNTDNMRGFVLFCLLFLSLTIKSPIFCMPCPWHFLYVCVRHWWEYEIPHGKPCLAS